MAKIAWGVVGVYRTTAKVPGATRLYLLRDAAGIWGLSENAVEQQGVFARDATGMIFVYPALLGGSVTVRAADGFVHMQQVPVLP